jgi:peptidyl-prolyl cis-trans isomerase C
MTLKRLVLPLLLLVFSPAMHAADVSTDALIDHLLGEQKSAPDAAARRASLKKEVAVQDALIKEAAKQGLTQTPDYAMRMELARRSVIVDMYWHAYLEKHPIDANSIKAAYDQLKTANGGKQYHLHQVYVDSEALAKQALDALGRKETFESVAVKFSQDRATSAQGGDLGWQLKSNLIGAVVEALPKLKPGEFTTSPLPIPKGFIILKLDEVRDFPEFDALKQQIATAMFQQVQQNELKRLQDAK